MIWHRSLLFLLAMAPAVGIGEWVAWLSSGKTEAMNPFPLVLVYIIITEAFGVMFFRLIYPSLIAELDDETLEERSVVIGSEPIPIRKLRLIEAREHHVHVTLDNSNLTQRARLSDIIAQTKAEDGVQPHRSWWVSAKAARGLERDGQRHVLTLQDGTKVPVARSRLADVRDWLKRIR